MYAKNLSEDDAFAWLEGVLTGAGDALGREAAAAAKKPAAREGDAEDSSRRLAAQCR